MRLPRLFRRREIPVPTAAGWLLLFGVAAAGLLGFARALFPYLAPTDPVGGGLLVVEGWGGASAFEEAARRWATGRYVHVVATGGPIERDSPIASAHTWAEFGAIALAHLGVPEEALSAVAAPASQQDRTFLSAVEVRDWLASRATPVRQIEVVTLGPHARRSRRLYELAFGSDVAIGVVAAPPEEYDAARWWTSSEGAKSILAETIGWSWTLCCFDPGPRGSHQERWVE